MVEIKMKIKFKNTWRQMSRSMTLISLQHNSSIKKSAKINKIRNEKEELASNRTETQMLLVIVTQKGNKMDN